MQNRLRIEVEEQVVEEWRTAVREARHYEKRVLGIAGLGAICLLIISSVVLTSMPKLDDKLSLVLGLGPAAVFFVGGWVMAEQRWKLTRQKLKGLLPWVDRHKEPSDIYVSGVRPWSPYQPFALVGRKQNLASM